MKKVFMFFTLAFFCISAYSQQKKDNPTQNTGNMQTNVIKTFADVNTFVSNAQKIEAYNFVINEKDKTVKDSVGVHNFKVKRKIPRIFGADVQSLKELLADTSKYSNVVPSCGDYPDLGFKFVNANNSLCVLINTRKVKGGNDYCAVARFYYNDSLLFAREILPIRAKYEELAKSLFPNDYPIQYVPVTVVSETNVVSNVVNQVNQTVDSTNVVNQTTNYLPKDNDFYTVVKDDKIKTICDKFKINEKEFLKLNPTIKKDKDLKVGTQVLIKTPELPEFHVIVKEDKIKSICDKYKIDVKKFQELNPSIKKDEDLKIGEKIKIK